MVKALISRITFFLLLTLLLSAYYLVHKPFTEIEFQAISGLFVDVASVAAFIILTAGIGRFVLLRLQLVPDSKIVRPAFESVFGLSLYGFVVLALGVIGLYTAPALWGVLILLNVFTWRETWAWVQEMRGIVYQALTPPTPWTRFFAVCVWLILITGFLAAFAPPTSWDGQAYHMVGVESYLQAGQIYAVTDNLYLGQSQGVDILFGVPFSLLGRDTSAAPVHFWFAVAGLIICAGIVRRCTDTFSAWVAMAVPLMGFSFWWLLVIPYVDLAIMAYAAAVVAAVFRWRETHETRWLWLIGYLIGVIVGVKYTAGLIALSIGLFIILSLPRPSLSLYVRRLVIYGVVMGVLIAAFFLPWAARGYFQYGNPIYPLGSSGLEWDALRASYLNGPDSGLISGGSAWQALIIPLSATVMGVNQAGDYLYDAGPFLLTLPFALLLVWGVLPTDTKRVARASLILLGPLVVVWAVVGLYYAVGTQTRLMIMMFPPFVIAGGIAVYGMSRLSEKPLNVFFIMRILLAGALLITTIDVLRETDQRRVLAYHLGNITRDEYILNDPVTNQLYIAFDALQTLADEGKIPADARVRFLWEPRSYFCPPEMTCVPDELLDHWRYPLETGQTVDEILAEWRANDEYILFWTIGYEYLLNPETGEDVDNSEAQTDKVNVLQQLPNFVESIEDEAQILWTNGVYTIYGWK